MIDVNELAISFVIYYVLDLIAFYKQYDRIWKLEHKLREIEKKMDGKGEGE